MRKNSATFRFLNGSSSTICVVQVKTNKSGVCLGSGLFGLSSTVNLRISIFVYISIIPIVRYSSRVEVLILVCALRKQGRHYCSVNYFRLHSIQYHKSSFRSRWFQSKYDWYATCIGMLGLTLSIQIFWRGVVWPNLVLVEVRQRVDLVGEEYCCSRREYCEIMI